MPIDDKDLPQPQPTKRDNVVALPCPQPVTVPVMIFTKPSKADILKMGAWRFGRGFVAGTFGTVVALGSAGIRGVDLLLWGVAGGVCGAFGLGIDKVFREKKNNKNYHNEVNLEVATSLVTGGSAVASLGWIPDMLIQYLDEFLVKIAEYAPDTADKHIKTACWLIQHYEADLHLLAAKSASPVDDLIVVEAVQAAKRIYPIA